MKRIAINERHDWHESAARLGFNFAFIDGTNYWNEAAAFVLTAEQVERDLKGPTAELHAMCVDLASRAVSDERLMDLLGVPMEQRDHAASSWADGELSLFGRFDLAYDGSGPAKMLEYNADTPVTIYEASVFQWHWLEDLIERGTLPKGSDQFNTLHEALIERFGLFRKDSILHFAGATTALEDNGSIEYLMDCALQAGHRVEKIDIAQIGIDAQGRFTDLKDRVIDQCFKLHPWEWLFETDYAANLAGSGCRFIEPAWKSIIATKAVLPILWDLHPGHPNLLPSYFATDERSKSFTNYVRKPLLSREGHNITLVEDGIETSTAGDYGDGAFVVQEAARMFRSEHGRAVVGSWIVGDAACGIGIREDAAAITGDTSRFVPHAIID